MRSFSHFDYIEEPAGTVTVTKILVRKQSETLTDFPVYVDLSTLGSGFWSSVTNGGGDIRCYASDGTTALPREVVSCATATDTGELHVKVTLSSTAMTEIQIWTDGTSSEPASDSTYGSEAVWSDYVAVLHLNTSSYTDSTGNSHSGTATGTVTQTTTDHPYGGTWSDFASGPDYLTLASTSGALDDTNFTVQAWVDRDADHYGGVISNRRIAGSTDFFQLNSSTTSPGNKWQAYVHDGTGGSTVNQYAGSLGVARLSLTTDSTDRNLYIDGSLGNSAALNVDGFFTNTYDITVGSYYDLAAGYSFNGRIGGVRIRADELSAAWIAAEYQNQSAPTDFYLTQEHLATITIPSNAPDASLTDYPAYVDLSHLTPAFWSTVANGGGDIRVFNADGTVELPREVVSCDPIAKTGELHVLTDLSVISDTQLRVYADGASSDYATTATYGAEAVFADYGFVSHDGGATDVTGNNTMTATGSPTANDTTGQMGDATSFNGTSQYYNTASSTGVAPGTSDITMQAWASNDITDFHPFIDIGQGTGSNPSVRLGFGTGTFNFLVQDNSTGSAFDVASGGTVSTSTLYKIDGVADRDTELRVYGNGVSQDSTTTTSNSTGSITPTNFRVGARNHTDEAYLDGVIDEVRVRLDALSADWISTEYSNQSNPFTFYSVSTPKELLTHVADVTIDATQVTSTLTDFPVYIKPDTASGWDTFWSTVADGGADVRLYRADDNDNELPREIVSCDQATDIGEIHALVDTLSSSVDTTIAVYADGSMLDYDNALHHKGRNAVWSDYALVMHNPVDLVDSAGNTSSITKTSAPFTTTGQLGDGGHFDGANDRINVPDFAQLNFSTADFCVSAWVNPDSVPASYDMVSQHYDATTTQGFALFNYSVGSDEWRFYVYGATATATAIGTINPTTTWQHLVGVKTSTQAELFLDGSTEATSVTTAGSVNSSGNIVIGDDYTITHPYDGTIDEYRVGLFAPSADWIDAEYTNQATPTTFYSVVDPNAGGATDYPVSVTFSISTSKTYGGAAGALGSMSNGVTASETLAAGAGALGSTSLGVTVSDSQAAVGAALGATTFSVTTSDTTSGTMTASRSMTNAVTMGDTSTALLSVVAQVTEAVTVDSTTSAQAVTLADASIGVTAGHTPSGAVTALAQFSAAVTVSESITGSKSFGAAVSFGASVDGVFTGQGNVTASISMSIEVAETILAQAAAQAGLTGAVISGLTIDGYKISADAVAQEGRIYRVEAEYRMASSSINDRTYRVEREDRTTTVLFDNRTHTVH